MSVIDDAPMDNTWGVVGLARLLCDARRGVPSLAGVEVRVEWSVGGGQTHCSAAWSFTAMPRQVPRTDWLKSDASYSVQSMTIGRMVKSMIKVSDTCRLLLPNAFITGSDLLAHERPANKGCHRPHVVVVTEC
jgi:hypothetical protein